MLPLGCVLGFREKRSLEIDLGNAGVSKATLNYLASVFSLRNTFKPEQTLIFNLIIYNLSCAELLKAFIDNRTIKTQRCN